MFEEVLVTLIALLPLLAPWALRHVEGFSAKLHDEGKILTRSPKRIEPQRQNLNSEIKHINKLETEESNTNPQTQTLNNLPAVAPKEALHTIVNTEELGLYHLPSKLHKYVIGPSGSVIKGIQSSNEVMIDLRPEQDNVKIVHPNSSEHNIQSAFEQIERTLGEVGWFYESGVWIEKLAYDEIFSKWNGKIELEAASMKKCFEDAKSNFDSGNKEEAKNLSNAGKVHQENMHNYKKQCAKEVFEFLNSKFDDYVIDLHGQLVTEAMEFVSERIDKLHGKATQPLQIITGAGNHSDGGGAKIKPAVVKYLLDKNLKFEQINNGTINVTL
ncbi:hypothetical protein AKO1_006482 [Acrasis kona]|uniref:Smr domain-containing protein n=1 Tax=Acrasis kona TaxID=1008807 RepID=A0AAW2YI94_9EUKA